jgi:acyl carrier protein
METTDQIQDAVREIMAETLAVEPEEIVPSARFFQDLGGESIDLIDLSFRCEKRFGVKVRFEEFSRAAELATDANGVLRPEAIADLKTRFPFFDYARFPENPRGSQLSDLLTVDAITHVVRAAVAGMLPGSDTA